MYKVIDSDWILDYGQVDGLNTTKKSEIRPEQKGSILQVVIGNKSLIETQMLIPVLCMLRHVLLGLNLF